MAYHKKNLEKLKLYSKYRNIKHAMKQVIYELSSGVEWPF